MVRSGWTVDIIVLVAALLCCDCDGHGRLIEPPSRASAWRYGFQTPPDYNDHELYCGGFTRQWKQNEGKCGECGDAWDLPAPRPHEYGGQWGQGPIVRKYLPGSEMTIRIELTASHMGYFEFRLCPEPDGRQECLDRHLLRILGGSPVQFAPGDLETRFYPRNGSRIYEIRSQLPDLICEQCLLQWRYVAGNNWGTCPHGNGAVGCGPQEEFRSCSDIALVEHAHTPIRPFRPSTRTTARPNAIPSSTENAPHDESAKPFNYLPILIVVILFVALVCAFAVWYLCRRHEQSVKEWLNSMGNRFCKRHKKEAAVSRRSVTPIVAASSVGYPAAKASEGLGSAPVPPPRTKRQLRVKEMSADESSVA